MKTVKLVLNISLGLMLIALLFAACDNPVSKPFAGKGAHNVVIRLSGSDGRTVLPVAGFSRFELTLQKEGGNPINVEDASGINGGGVSVNLSVGTWTVTLKAYRDINGNSVLAARGIETVTVAQNDITKEVFVKLQPLGIDADAAPGVFAYNIILPPGVETAALSLYDSGGNPVGGYDSLNLLEAGNCSGFEELAAGFYDLTLILTKNGQSAGWVEAVHIYPGLESPFNLDLGAVEFADKVYITGTLGGVRLGKVKITGDAAGQELIKELELNEIELNGNSAERRANWIIDIPSAYIGETVYAVQEFNGEKSGGAAIDNLPINGVKNIALSLKPATAELRNIAPWYSKITVSGGDNPDRAADGETGTYWNVRGFSKSAELELDFGFPVTVNSSQVIFYSGAGGEAGLDEYILEYWDGGWVEAAKREQALKGSTDASVKYGDFFNEISAQRFKWTAVSESGSGSVALVQFGLFKAADRSGFSGMITEAENNHKITPVSADGSEISSKLRWVTRVISDNYRNAINDALAAIDDPAKSASELSSAQNVLAAATAAFIDAQKRGLSYDNRVEEFGVQDGYADKFVISWIREADKKYVISISEDNRLWSEVDVIPNLPGEDADTYLEDFSYTVTSGISAGVTRYIAVKPILINGGEEEGEIAQSGLVMTLGVPEVSLNGGLSYSTVSLSWTAAQKADAYRIIYSYINDPGHSGQMELGEDVTSYSFRPDGFDNAAKSGHEMEIKVEALNKGLHDIVGGPPILTSSSPVATKLVGPAALATEASRAASATNITVSWNKIDGIAGYYVFRRQFDMNNTAQEGNALAYYVPATEAASIAISGKEYPSISDISPIKAAASFADGRFTLTDTWLEDSENSGSDYNNRQNDMAQGYPYRYLVVPVLANEPLSSINYTGDTYTIQDVTYTNAVSIEKTGFTFGFGRDITATKGTYALSGNVNDGIRITWNAPPLYAGGLTPEYTVYRRAHNATEWDVAGTANGTEYVDFAGAAADSANRGIAYDYLVGISGSQPYASSRFVAGETDKQGYMLAMVKMLSVSRNEQKAGDDFAEEVTWLRSGIKNGGTDNNWGIDGYTVYVMNRNINGSWHVIADDNDNDGAVLAAANTDANQSVKVTGKNKPLVGGDELLKVLRDYKHFFKVRSYVEQDGERIYCPDPVYDYEALYLADKPLRTHSNNTTREQYRANENKLQTDYVKWGARQVTTTEYARIATLHIAWGIHFANGTRTSWTSKLGRRSYTTNNNGSTGEVGAESSSGVGMWWFDFQNYRPDLDTNANRNNWDQSVTFLTIETNGKGDSGTISQRRAVIFAEASASSQYPRFYGWLKHYRGTVFASYADYGVEFMDIKGPADTPSLYTGKLKFDGPQIRNQEGDGSGGLRGDSGWVKGGWIAVKYPADAAEVHIEDGELNTPLPFHAQPTDPAERTKTDAWY